MNLLTRKQFFEMSQRLHVATPISTRIHQVGNSQWLKTLSELWSSQKYFAVPNNCIAVTTAPLFGVPNTVVSPTVVVKITGLLINAFNVLTIKLEENVSKEVVEYEINLLADRKEFDFDMGALSKFADSIIAIERSLYKRKEFANEAHTSKYTLETFVPNLNLWLPALNWAAMQLEKSGVTVNQENVTERASKFMFLREREAFENFKHIPVCLTPEWYDNFYYSVIQPEALGENGNVDAFKSMSFKPVTRLVGLPPKPELGKPLVVEPELDEKQKELEKLSVEFVELKRSLDKKIRKNNRVINFAECELNRIIQSNLKDEAIDELMTPLIEYHENIISGRKEENEDLQSDIVEANKKLDDIATSLKELNKLAEPAVFHGTIKHVPDLSGFIIDRAETVETVNRDMSPITTFVNNKIRFTPVGDVKGVEPLYNNPFKNVTISILGDDGLWQDLLK